MFKVAFTMDVEDPEKNSDGSFITAVDMILAWLDSAEKKGSFFVVGELAAKHPSLVRRISSQGHELALHGLEHVALDQLTAEKFAIDTARGKSIIEDITGKPVVGYRAPMFSLTSKTLWAPEILMSLGFSYSSSVLPAANPRYSMADAPKNPFKWPCGLVELPAPVTNIMGISVPFLGGIYFRNFPNWLIDRALDKLETDQVPWFYCHPYDFRINKRYIVMKDTPLWVNALLMLNRGRNYEKMKTFFTDLQSTATLSELAHFHTGQTA